MSRLSYKNSKDQEETTIALLRRCSAMDVVMNQCLQFEKEFGSLPEICYIAKQNKRSFLVEAVRAGFDPAIAEQGQLALVIEGKTILIFFSESIMAWNIHLLNNRIKKELFL